MRYFVQTVRFSPSFEELGYLHIGNNQYLYSDNSVWEAKKLMDLGWGAENGLFRLPLPSYENLLDLVFQPVVIQKKISDEQYNFWGALSVLLEEYPLLFLHYLETKMDNYCFLEKFSPLYGLINRVLYWDEKKIDFLPLDQQEIALKWIKVKGKYQMSQGIRKK